MLRIEWDLDELRGDQVANRPAFAAAIAETEETLAGRPTVRVNDTCRVGIGNRPNSDEVVTSIRRCRPTAVVGDWTCEVDLDRAIGSSPAGASTETPVRSFVYRRVAAAHETPNEIVDRAVQQLLLPPERRDQRLDIRGFACPTCGNEQTLTRYRIEVAVSVDKGDVGFWCGRCGEPKTINLSEDQRQHLRLMLDDSTNLVTRGVSLPGWS